ncbi:MAG: permease-like cell division protein FtsX [Syntrophomonadaceae bacterium]|nr:permease-like cell division protein FtsX [Syntrophomonadaceae bacterium]
MNMKNIGFFFKEAFISMKRNRLLAFATLSTVTICLCIVGAAMLLTLNMEAFMHKLGSDQEIKVYINATITEDEVSALGAELREVTGVEKVTYVSKEQGLRELQEDSRLKGYDLTGILGSNPLPDSFRVKAESVEMVETAAQGIEALYGVDDVTYGENIVQKLAELTDNLRLGSIIIIALLAFGSIFLIATTIRLSIFSRRKEVTLMRLIGAGNWFIRWPFFIEGILLGLLGSIIALGLLGAAYNALLSNVQIAISFIPLISDFGVLRPYALALLGGGALLGVSGTWISLNRFLKV